VPQEPAQYYVYVRIASDGPPHSAVHLCPPRAAPTPAYGAEGSSCTPTPCGSTTSAAAEAAAPDKRKEEAEAEEPRAAARLLALAPAALPPALRREVRGAVPVAAAAAARVEGAPLLGDVLPAPVRAGFVVMVGGKSLATSLSSARAPATSSASSTARARGIRRGHHDCSY
jgi:hypothetical protein